MRVFRTFSASAVVLASILTACATDSTTAPQSPSLSRGSDSSNSGVGALAAGLRLRCEVRGTQRSKISVDASGLSPRTGSYTASVTSGANAATAPARAAVRGEAEFDFDSNPADIAAGATPISRTFIQVNASGPDVMAQVRNAAGVVVAQGSADCRVR